MWWIQPYICIETFGMQEQRAQTKPRSSCPHLTPLKAPREEKGPELTARRKRTTIATSHSNSGQDAGFGPTHNMEHPKPHAIIVNVNPLIVTPLESSLDFTSYTRLGRCFSHEGGWVLERMEADIPALMILYSKTHRSQ